MSVVEIRSYVGEPSRIGSAAFDLVRPVDGTVIGRIFEAGPEGVEAAVRLASLVYQANRKTPLHQRVAWLHAAAVALTANADEIAALICEDVGKPIRSARFEVRRGADFLLGCAAALSQMNGDVLPLDSTATGEGRFGFTRRVPYGVVAGIKPFNAPVNLLVQKVGPAIAAGNAIIVKPAPAGTRTALKLAELFEQAGWPKGLYIVLAGDRPSAGALVAHPLVRAVSFTGGTAGGDALARAAGAKKFVPNSDPMRPTSSWRAPMRPMLRSESRRRPLRPAGSNAFPPSAFWSIAPSSNRFSKRSWRRQRA